MKTLALLTFLSIVTGSASTHAVESNEAAARAIFDEILSRGRFERVPDFYAPDFVNHAATRDASLEQDMAAARMWRSVSNDLVFMPEIVVAEGDLVAIFWRSPGTHTGPFNEIPATGLHVEGRGMTVWRFVNGKATEEWTASNRSVIMEQLATFLRGATVQPIVAGPLVERVPKPASRRTLRRNRDLVLSLFEEVLGKGRFDLTGSMLSNRFVSHEPKGDASARSLIETARALRSNVPDLTFVVMKSVSEGDLVAVIYTVSGTPTGGAAGTPANGRPFRVRGMSIMSVDRGRVAEEWTVLDRSQLP